MNQFMFGWKFTAISRLDLKCKSRFTPFLIGHVPNSVILLDL